PVFRVMLEATPHLPFNPSSVTHPHPHPRARAPRPVFRVMLEATRGKAWPAEHFAFVGHCHVHGEARRVGWRDLGAAACAACRAEGRGGGGSGSDESGGGGEGTGGGGEGSGGGAQPGGARRGAALALSGPMWTGPLHDRAFVARMASEASRLGWTGHAVPLDSPYREKGSKNNRQRPLEGLLSLFWEEADERLPPWYIPVDAIGQRLDRSPGRDELIAALARAGHAACRCHIDQKAIKTSASMAQALQAAAGIGYVPRPPAAGGGRSGRGGGAAAAGASRIISAPPVSPPVSYTAVRHAMIHSSTPRSQPSAPRRPPAPTAAARTSVCPFRRRERAAATGASPDGASLPALYMMVGAYADARPCDAAARRTPAAPPAGALVVLLAAVSAAALLQPAGAQDVIIASWNFPGGPVTGTVTYTGTDFIPTVPLYPNNPNGIADNGTLVAGSRISGHYAVSNPWYSYGGVATGDVAIAGVSWATGDYWEIQASTAGYTNIFLQFKIRISSVHTSWKTNVNPSLGVGDETWSESAAGSFTFTTGSFTGPHVINFGADFENRAKVGIRLVNQVARTTGTPTVRLDAVELHGTPAAGLGAADPHFTGFGGHSFFFDGREGAAFSIFSERDHQVNAEFGSLGPKHGVNSSIWMTGFGVRYRDATSLVDATTMRVKLPEGRFLHVELDGAHRDDLAGSGTSAPGMPPGVVVHFPPASAVNPGDASDGPVAVVRTRSLEIAIFYESEGAAHLDVKITVVGPLVGQPSGLIGQTLAWATEKGPGAAILDGVLAAENSDFEVTDGILGTAFPGNRFDPLAGAAPHRIAGAAARTRSVLWAPPGGGRFVAKTHSEARPQPPN
ncbi:MAG: hypothetical protein J3K34DRAFT_393209, partial [Monoraphidium minutum]